jgi:glycosyltransferase involved in cell wall biosynthesis
VRVALIHDWLVTNRGGEKVLDALCELFPEAELFTLIHRKGSVSARVEDRPIHTSFLQRVPGVFTHYRNYLPLFPSAIRSFDLTGFDLVLSSSHCVAKGVRIPKGTRHLSYVHAPMRYMWDLFDDYFGPGRASPPVRVAARLARPALRAWDTRTDEVHRFVANSQNVAQKISRFYGRTASVVPPPVELERFTRMPLEGSGQGGYFLWVGAPAPYKRLDLVVDVMAKLGLPFWVVGPGQLEPLLRHAPSNVRFLGNVEDDQLPGLYREARALLFPGEEDFGITPVESLACGRPVIAFAKGGALETVTPQTGLFFHAQTPEALTVALQRFDSFEKRFSPAAARERASAFTRARFLEAMRREVEAVLGTSQPRSSV